MDVSAITLVQNHFLQYLSEGFTDFSLYAKNLLYFFAVLEVALFGILWMLQQEAQWGDLILKVIKIGFIFFVIDNFAYFFNLLLSGFSSVSGLLANTSELSTYIFNPAILWGFGYDVCMALLQNATASNIGFGLALIEVVLGLGTLIGFAVLGIQIVLQLTALYLTALFSLIFLPLGVFSTATNMAGTAVTSVLRAAVRVSVVIVVVGLAVTTFRIFNLEKISTNVTMNFSLGLFVMVWLFAYLAAKLPKMIASVVGQLFSIPAARGGQTQYVATQPFIPATSGAGGSMNLQAASSVQPVTSGSGAAGSVSNMQAAAAVPATPAAASVNVSAPTASNTGAASLNKMQMKAMMTQASMISRSISEETVNKLRHNLKHAND